MPRLLPLLQILILVHTVDGRGVYINPKTIVSLSEKVGKNNLLTDNAQCLVSFVDGKFIGVKESCTDVRTRLQERP